jgi:hypothetical protein
MTAGPYYDDQQRSFFEALPDSITVYRGCDAAFISGVSWTVNRKKAEYFANGGRLSAPEDPVLLTAAIDKDDRSGRG